MVGRVVNTLGFPIDGKGPWDLYQMPLKKELFSSTSEPLQTGIKAVDMIPVGRGQRLLVTVKQVNQLFVLTLS
jgi:F-type H+-transporting ATPase subunit alpha